MGLAPGHYYNPIYFSLLSETCSTTLDNELKIRQIDRRVNFMHQDNKKNIMWPF